MSGPSSRAGQVAPGRFRGAARAALVFSLALALSGCGLLQPNSGDSGSGDSGTAGSGNGQSSESAPAGLLKNLGKREIPLGQSLAVGVTVPAVQPDQLALAVEPVPLPDNARFDPATGTFHFRPGPAQVGEHRFTFTARKGGSTQRASLAVTVEPGDGTTALSGRILDSNAEDEVPVVGATVSTRHQDVSATTGPQGRFTLEGLEPPEIVLTVDGSTADKAPDGRVYASFNGRMQVIEGATKAVGRPIYLPRINPASLTQVEPDKATKVENPDIGVELDVPANSAQNPQDGSAFTGELSVSQLDSDRAPRQLPATFDPGMLVTIQPAGVQFRDPAQISFPNTDNLEPGSEVEIRSVDPEAGRFVVSGTGRVTDDGERIEMVEGGIDAADWHFPAPDAVQARPGQPGVGDTSDTNGEVQPAMRQSDCQLGSSVGMQDGCLIVSHAVPAHRSFGRQRRLRLVYDGQTAHPTPVINTETTLDDTTSVPDAFALNLQTVAGIQKDVRVFSEAGRDGLRQALSFDASGLPTGRYPYSVLVESHYPESVRSTEVTGNVLVNNRSASPIGAGWRLAGISDVIETDGPGLLLRDGEGALKRFAQDKVFKDSATTYQAGKGAEAVVTGDFNGDGKLDAAVANALNYNSQAPGKPLTLLLGDGEGGFSTQQIELDGIPGPEALAAADFNDDGHLDLVFGRAEVVTGDPTPDLYVVYGQSGTSFGPIKTLEAGTSIADVVAADVNGDGRPDIVAGASQPEAVFVRISKADGSFAAGEKIALDIPAHPLAQGDFNDDGRADVAVASGNKDKLPILTGRADGTLARAAPLGASTDSSALAVGDFNGDGSADLASDGLAPDPWEPDRMGVRLGRGDATFGPGPAFDLADDSLTSLAAGDLNGDGRDDLVLAYGERLSIRLARPDGTFETRITRALNRLTAEEVDCLDDLALADFNDDGALDAVTPHACSGHATVLLGESRDVLAGPAGDFTKLIRHDDGSYTRRFPDGTTTEFNADGQQIARRRPSGRETTYSYDDNGRLTQITGPAGKTTRLSYAGGQLAEIEGPAGRVTQLAHDDRGNLTRITAPDDTTRRFSYDGKHRLTAQTDRRDETTEYSYGPAGRVATVTLPDGTTRRTGSTKAAALPAEPAATSVADPAPSMAAESVTGRVAGADGKGVAIATDKLGAATRLRDELDRTTEIQRNGDGQATRVSSPGNVGETRRYDPLGNLTRVEQGAGYAGEVRLAYKGPYPGLVTAIDGPAYNITTIRYTQDGLPKRLNDGRYPGSPLLEAVGPVIELSYGDAACPGQPTERIAAAGSDHAAKTTLAYDPESCNPVEASDALGRTTRRSYDDAGNVTGITDPKDRTTRLAYDTGNRVTKIVSPARDSADPACGTAGVMCFAYDDAGNLTQATDGRGGQTRFTYDGRGRLVERTDAAGKTATVTYSGDGNLVRQTDRKDQVASFTYDDAGQLEKKTLQPGTDGEARHRFDYNAAGRIVAASDPDSRVTRDYSGRGRLSSTSTKNSPSQPGVSVGFYYNDDDTRAVLFVDEAKSDFGLRVDYGRNDRGRVTSIDAGAAGSIEFAYDARGRRTAVTRPNGADTELAYDAASQVERIAHQPANASEPFARFAYSYDKAGNRTDVAQRRAGPEVKDQLDYRYDARDQLVAATRPLAGAPAESFTYDALGNRLSRDGQAGQASFDSANRLQEDAKACYSYDANGNRTRRTAKVDGACTGRVTEYRYDSQDHLIAVLEGGTTVAEYRYDAFGRRIAEKRPAQTRRYIYDGQDILLEYNGDNERVAVYFHGPERDAPHAMRRDIDDDGALETLYYHLNALGSVIALTNSAGEVVQSYAYDAFGETTIFDETGQQIDPAEAIENPYGFTGRHFDPATGLYYYRARYYAPRTGRFISEDPIGLAGGDANLYRYVGNNPVNRTDPRGLSGDPATLPTLLSGKVGATSDVLAERAQLRYQKRLAHQVIKGTGPTRAGAFERSARSLSRFGKGYATFFKPVAGYNLGVQTARVICDPTDPDKLLDFGTGVASFAGAPGSVAAAAFNVGRWAGASLMTTETVGTWYITTFSDVSEEVARETVRNY